MFSQSASSSLIGDNEIETWVKTMFGAAQGPNGEGVRLVVKIGGKAVATGHSSVRDAHDDEETRAAIRELTQSLAMYGLEQPGDTVVARPSTERITRALGVLADPAARRQTLGAALTIFGRRVTAPLERVLGSSDEGTTARLTTWRNGVRMGIESLKLTTETAAILEADLAKVLSDEYLAMLGENEEKTLRPRLTELAHRVMDVLASTFHHALDRFGTHAPSIGDRIVRRLPKSMALRELPTMLKAGFVDAVAEFLEVETSAELQGALQTLSTQYADVAPTSAPLSFATGWYRDIGEECWNVIVTYC